MGRAFEGRALPRPDDELVDQGLAFEIGTLLSWRRTLRLLGIGAFAGLAACSAPSTVSCAATSGPASARRPAPPKACR